MLISRTEVPTTPLFIIIITNIFKKFNIMFLDKNG